MSTDINPEFARRKLDEIFALHEVGRDLLFARGQARLSGEVGRATLADCRGARRSAAAENFKDQMTDSPLGNRHLQKLRKDVCDTLDGAGVGYATD